MRDILFRGKKWEKSVFDETDWVYGSLIDSGNHEQVTIYPWFNGASTMSVRQLVYSRMEAVNPETVGQFTGQSDCNGDYIFECDVVYYEKEDENGVVEWDDDSSRFVVLFDGWMTDFDCLYGRELEVIGNIHDNPELINN